MPSEFDTVTFLRMTANMLHVSASESVVISGGWAREMSAKLAAIAEQLTVLSENKTWVGKSRGYPPYEFKVDNDWEPSASDPPLRFINDAKDSDLEASEDSIEFISWDTFNERVAKRIEESK